MFRLLIDLLSIICLLYGDVITKETPLIRNIVHMLLRMFIQVKFCFWPQPANYTSEFLYWSTFTCLCKIFLYSLKGKNIWFCFWFVNYLSTLITTYRRYLFIQYMWTIVSGFLYVVNLQYSKVRIVITFIGLHFDECCWHFLFLSATVFCLWKMKTLKHCHFKSTHLYI